MIAEINSELRNALLALREKHGEEAAREALRFYLTGLTHAAMLSQTFANEAATELNQVIGATTPVVDHFD